jgi:RNA polymerase sigma-70 factor (ECF subfamily)
MTMVCVGLVLSEASRSWAGFMHIFYAVAVLLFVHVARAAATSNAPESGGSQESLPAVAASTEKSANGEPEATPLEETDQALAKRARTSRAAFGELYERHVAAIYRYVYYRVGSVEDTEDLTARVFARALKHIHNYNDRGLPFMAWMYRIAHNVVANYHRDSKRHPSVPLDDVDLENTHVTGDAQDEAETAAAADLRIDSERERGLLIEAIRKLPEERQQLVVLKFVQQLPNVEIGQVMGRSEGAIKSLYHRTLAHLRELMMASSKE